MASIATNGPGADVAAGRTDVDGSGLLMDPGSTAAHVCVNAAPGHPALAVGTDGCSLLDAW